MNEDIFRILTAVIFAIGLGISVYHRYKADKESGEKVARSVDGMPMMLLIRVVGLTMWLSPLVYMINPQWMAWSKMNLPEPVRWLGVGLGLLCDVLIYWVFSSIGSNITATSATRKEHKLVTRGPYRWIRHPLYTVGSTFFVAFGIMADSWFFAALGIIAFIGMASRTPKEEARLVEKFGDEYRNYMKTTGRFLPKLF